MKFGIGVAALCVALFLSAPAMSQSAPAADPAAVFAARDLVSKMQGDKNAVLQSMAAPMAGLIAGMGVKEPDRAQILVNEVIIPTLASKYDDLLDLQARAFASALSATDLKAAATFYATPAGRNFAAAQPKLAQAQMAGIGQLIGSLAPEIQSKLAQAIQKYGWGPAGKK